MTAGHDWFFLHAALAFEMPMLRLFFLVSKTTQRRNELFRLFARSHFYIVALDTIKFSANTTAFRKMNRLFAASLLVALAAILLNAPAVAAGKSVLAQDPTQGQDTFGNIRVGRLMKVRA